MLERLAVVRIPQLVLLGEPRLRFKVHKAGVMLNVAPGAPLVAGVLAICLAAILRGQTKE